VVGPITRSADDLELLLTAAMGPLPLEARGWKLDLPPAPASLKGMRFALLMDSDFAPVEQAVRAALGAFADWLRSEGATVTTVALPLPQLEHQLLFLALLKGVLSTRMDDAGFAAALENARRFDAADTGFDAIAARDMVQHHRTWARHNEARAKLRDTWRTFFESFDCLLLPGTPTAAFAIDESEPQGKRTLDVDGRRVPYGVQGFWQGIASTSYLPATVAPIGRSSTGLPLSVQIVGGAFDDLKTIAVARHAEAHYFPFSPPAGFA
jgi:amidase